MPQSMQNKIVAFFVCGKLVLFLLLNFFWGGDKKGIERNFLAKKSCIQKKYQNCPAKATPPCEPIFLIDILKFAVAKIIIFLLKNSLF